MGQYLRSAALGAILLSASAALAKDVGPPLQNLKTFAGRAEMQSESHRVTLRLLGNEGETLQRFSLVVAGEPELPEALSTAEAQIMLWEGNLVVIAPREGKAFHFEIPSINQLTRRNAAARRLPLQVSPEALDSDLEQRYALTRISSVVSIVAVGGPAARQPDSPDSLERDLLKAGIGISEDIIPSDEGGLSSCGVSCEINCANGSHCSVSCGQRQCASCRCPALCQCS